MLPFLLCLVITAAYSYGDVERREEIANSKTDRKSAKAITFTAALMKNSNDISIH